MRRNIFLMTAIFCTFVLSNRAIVCADTDENQAKWNVNLAAGLITGGEDGLQFKKIHSIAGKKDVIQYAGGLQLSPNSKFLIQHNQIVPLENGDVHKLVDFPSIRSSWSPDGKKIAFYSGGIWLIPVSPETGRATGPAKKIIDGDYWYKVRVQWAPDSDRIAFHSNDGQIHIISVSDGSRTQLTKGGIFLVQGAWSPDGRHIACRHPGGGVWIVPINGGDPIKLIETQRRVLPYWSPDGKWIFYESSGKLQFVRVSDSIEFDISLPEEAGSFISLSSDGKLLFYRPSYEWTDTLKIVSSSGGEPIYPIRGNVLSAIDQQWSPDGNFVITRGMHDDKWVNWIVPVTGETPYPLRIEAPVDVVLEQRQMSPDSRKVLFSSKSTNGKIQYWTTSVSLMSGKASGAVTRVFDKGRAKYQRWSPDSSKLMFFFNKELWLSRADGSSTMKVAGSSDRDFPWGRYRCSPEGSAVSWLSYSPSAKRSALHILKLSEHKSRKILETSKFLRYEWSPDGSRIAYTLYGPDETDIRELFVVDILDGVSKKLIKIDPNEYHTGFAYEWSPGGESIALVAGRKLLLYNFADGASEQLGSLNDPVLGRCFGMAWSPDRRALALIMEEKPEKSKREEFGTRVFMVTVPGGTWTELDGEPGYNYSVNWSPDGKWISYDSEEHVKIRPQGILWELDIDSYLKQMSQKVPE